MPLRPVAPFHLQTTYSRSTWLFSYSLEDERYRDCKWASRALRGRVQCPQPRRPPHLDRAEVWRHQRGEVRPEHRRRHCTVSQPRTNPPPGEKAKQSARGPRAVLLIARPGRTSRIINWLSSAQREVQERRWKALPAGQHDPSPLASRATNANNQSRSLLEIFGVLEAVNVVKDTESVHYESLVCEYERLVQEIGRAHV